MRGDIKQIVLRNIKAFAVYFLCYLISALLFAQSEIFSELYDRICFKIFSQTGWDETVKIWTIIVIVINLIIMSKYALKFNKNNSVSVAIYIFTCFTIGNLWFWISVLPGFVVYAGSDGILS